MAWRTDYAFPVRKSGGLKRTIKEYLRENFYGGILAGEYVDQEPGAMDSELEFVVQGLSGHGEHDRYRPRRVHHRLSLRQHEAARQFFDQMPINPDDKEKIAHLNAERLLKL